MESGYIHRDFRWKVEFISFHWCCCCYCWFVILLCFVRFLSYFITVASEIFGLKSIAAYRSGLEINTNVARKDAEEGLAEVLQGEYSKCIGQFH